MELNYIPEPNTGCWLWLGSLDRGGYGKLASGAIAHRVVYEQHKGPIPEGRQLDHLCRQRSCVNPDHLEPVTRRENVIRGNVSRGADRTGKPFCKHGHALTPENTYTGRGWDECRVCRREAKQRFDAARIDPANGG